MKKRLVMAFLVIVAAFGLPLPAGAQQAAAGDELASVPRIDLPAFKKLLATGDVLVLDVRDVEQYKMGHIPGARSMPLDEVGKRAAELKTEKRPIVTYCG